MPGERTRVYSFRAPLLLAAACQCYHRKNSRETTAAFDISLHQILPCYYRATTDHSLKYILVPVVRFTNLHQIKQPSTVNWLQIYQGDWRAIHKSESDSVLRTLDLCHAASSTTSLLHFPSSLSTFCYHSLSLARALTLPHSR